VHNRAAIESRPLADHIAMIEGSSIDSDVVKKVFAFAGAFARPLVVLDSNHSHQHVLSELFAYSPLVQAGSYIVVMDTCVEYISKAFSDRNWGRGGNTLTATRAFLSRPLRLSSLH